MPHFEGTVTDPNGAVVPGAKMTLINEANSGAQLELHDRCRGRIQLPQSRPGVYDLSVSAPAFETFVRKGIELAVNQTARIDVQPDRWQGRPDRHRQRRRFADQL